MAMATASFCFGATAAQNVTSASTSGRPGADAGISGGRRSSARAPARSVRQHFQELRGCGFSLEQSFFSGRSAVPAKSRSLDLGCKVLQTDRPATESAPEDPIERLKRLVDLGGGNSLAAIDEELYRFLKVAKNNVEKAAKAFVTHQRWKHDFIPKGYVLEKEVPAELASKKAYWINSDKKGRPALYATGRNHVYNQNFDEFKRFVVYAFSRLISEAPSQSDQFVAIVDLKGLGFKNLDAKSFLAAFEILQKHYPQRLEKVYMINVPFIFNGIWKVVKPVIDEDTRSRIVFVDNKKLTETLSQDIDPESLPRDCGGKAQLVLLQDAVTPNWPPSTRW